ncbi:hypothetical protein TYRP_020013 [Tyrophagus putrescentiae]|nr:hypothetical protein TYRP_020013 [Tyrophagus putrescentiae]
MQLLVKLKSADNVVIAVEEKVVRLSGLVGSVLAQNDDGIPVEAISCPATAHILQLVIAWCEYHKNDPDCLQNEYLANLDNLRNLPEWDEQWLSEQWDNSTLTEVITAAEQMKIPKLLYLARRMQRVRSARVNLLANNNNNNNNNHGQMEIEEAMAEVVDPEVLGLGAGVLVHGPIFHVAAVDIEAPVAAAPAAPPAPAPEPALAPVPAVAAEVEGGQAENAEGNDRPLPVLHSQAIIEIAHVPKDLPWFPLRIYFSVTFRTRFEKGATAHLSCRSSTVWDSFWAHPTQPLCT